MIIIDYINGEMISVDDRIDAYREARSRLKYHNSEFDYVGKGHHYSQNAEMSVDGDRIYIRRKGQ